MALYGHSLAVFCLKGSETRLFPVSQETVYLDRFTKEYTSQGGKKSRELKVAKKHSFLETPRKTRG